MGAPMGNRNAAGSHKRRSVSSGAKRYLAKISGRSKFTRTFKRNWGKGSTKWEIRKALHSARYSFNLSKYK